MPSYDVILKQDTVDSSIVWDECKRPLYRYGRRHMENQQKPLKVRVGCDFTIFKPMPIGDMNIYIYFLNDDEDANHEYRGNYMFKDLNVSTKNISVYSPETMKEAILSLEDELDDKLKKAIANIEGSGWSIYKFNKMSIVLHTNATARAGSYIKTPENIIILNAESLILKMKITNVLNTVHHITKLNKNNMTIDEPYSDNSITNIIIIIDHILQV